MAETNSGKNTEQNKKISQEEISSILKIPRIIASLIVVVFLLSYFFFDITLGLASSRPGIFIFVVALGFLVVPLLVKSAKGRDISIVKLILIVGLLIGAYFLTTAVINWQKTGAEVTVTGEEVLKETGIVGFIKNSVQDALDLLQGTYSWKEAEVAEKEPSGIKITKLFPGRSYFESGQDVIIRAQVNVDALQREETRIKFECEMDKLKGEIEISGATGNTVNLDPGRSRNLAVICTFKNYELKESSQTTKKVKLTGRYENFVTRNTLKVYTLSEEAFKEVGTKNAFDYFGVEESLLSSGGLMRSQCVLGCGLTKLSLKTSPQPLTELGSHFLDIKLQNDRDWYGDVRKAHSLSVVQSPNNLQIEPCLVEDPPLNGSCKFKVSQPDDILGENVQQFIVEARYDYEVEKKTTVDIKPARISTTPEEPKEETNQITSSFIVAGVLEEVLQ